MFWCYQCSKLIPPTAQLACPVCHSQAIEELNEGIDPVIFLLERREE